jgi:diacylglycerol kinase (ATP)
MKNQPLLRRSWYALNGILSAAKIESSFRTELVLAAIAAIGLTWLRPPLVMVALCVIAAGLVLAVELLNTSIEHLADRLHPEQHPTIGIAKDCASAAVMVTLVIAVVVGGMTVAVGLGLVKP